MQTLYFSHKIRDVFVNRWFMQKIWGNFTNWNNWTWWLKWWVISNEASSTKTNETKPCKFYETNPVNFTCSWCKSYDVCIVVYCHTFPLTIDVYLKIKQLVNNYVEKVLRNLFLGLKRPWQEIKFWRVDGELDTNFK